MTCRITCRCSVLIKLYPISLNEKLGNIRYIQKPTFESAWNDSESGDFYVIDIVGEPEDKPNDLSGNRFFGFQWKSGGQNFGYQLAFGFGTDKIAINRIINGKWSGWDYFVPKSYVDNKISIEKTNFIISSTTVEFQGLNAVINKNIVSCYLKIKIKSTLQNNYIGTIKAPYIPYLQQVFSTLHASGSASYQAQGTIWIDGNGAVTAYGLSVGETYYAYLSWIIK